MTSAAGAEPIDRALSQQLAGFMLVVQTCFFAGRQHAEEATQSTLLQHFKDLQQRCVYVACNQARCVSRVIRVADSKTVAAAADQLLQLCGGMLSGGAAMQTLFQSNDVVSSSCSCSFLTCTQTAQHFCCKCGLQLSRFDHIQACLALPTDTTPC